jgi:KTSC domain
MKQTVNGTLFIIELNQLDSSFLSQIVYDAKTEVLSVVLKNENVYNYANVPLETFVEFSTTNSFGSFYNSNIKSKFKHMANEVKSSGKQQPNKINKAGDFKRFIKMSIDLTKINKTWLYKGETGALYLKLTLMLLPDGEVDRFGNLGMIVQDTPAEVAKADKSAKGEILGNGQELEWTKQEEKVEKITEEDADILDGLPF